MATTAAVRRRQATAAGIGIRRLISWRDFNPYAYAQRGYVAVRGYWYDGAGKPGDGGEDNGGAESADNIEYVDQISTTPVFIDLRNKDDEDEELTLEKLGNLSTMSILMLFRFRMYILRVLAKYLKVLFEEHYEYLLLSMLFLIL